MGEPTNSEEVGIGSGLIPSGRVSAIGRVTDDWVSPGLMVTALLGMETMSPGVGPSVVLKSPLTSTTAVAS